MKSWMIWIGTAALLVGACKKQIDKDKLEKAIKDQLGSQIGAPYDSVECPKGQKIKKDDVFTCTMKMGGLTIPVEVTQTSNSGDVHMRLVAMVVTKSVQEVVDKKVPGATIDCGGAVKPAKQGESFECSVTGAPGVTEIKVTATDGYGAFNVNAVTGNGGPPAGAPEAPTGGAPATPPEPAAGAQPEPPPAG